MTDREQRELVMKISRNISDMIYYRITIANGGELEPFSHLHEAQSNLEENLLQLIKETT